MLLTHSPTFQTPVELENRGLYLGQPMLSKVNAFVSMLTLCELCACLVMSVTRVSIDMKTSFSRYLYQHV